MYRREGGGTVCVDAFIAALLVGGALVLKFLFYAAVSAACPYSAGDASSLARNITNIITIEVLNGLDMANTAGDMTQMQSQSVTQAQSATQTLSNVATLTAAHTAQITHSQSQSDSQTQTQDDSFTNRRRRRRREAWGLPDLSLDVCKMLRVYIAG